LLLPTMHDIIAYSAFLTKQLSRLHLPARSVLQAAGNDSLELRRAMSTRIDYSRLAESLREPRGRRTESPAYVAAQAQYTATLAALTEARTAYREARRRHENSKDTLRALNRVSTW
jgi:hypothetical protein